MGAEAQRLATAARGGRVAHSGFLEPDEGDLLLAELRRQGIDAMAWGGYPGAVRRVVTAFPSHVPEAHARLAAVYLAGVSDEGAVRAAATSAGVERSHLGDLRAHSDGISVVTFDPPPEALLDLRQVAGRPVQPQVVPVERVAGGRSRRTSAVVPSLRVDVVAAKAFGVSRAYFSKGVAGGKVRINGRTAGKSASIEAGDEVYAEGLGRMRLLTVDGETRRGNLKVSVEVESG